MSDPTTDFSTPSTCANCGAALVAGAAFCRECGTPRQSSPPAPTEPAVDQGGAARCTACGTELKDGGAFCRFCGAPAPAQGADAPVTPPPLPPAAASTPAPPMPTPVAPASPAPQSPGPAGPSPAASAPGSGRHRGPLLFAAIVVALLLGAGGAFLLFGRDKTNTLVSTETRAAVTAAAPSPTTTPEPVTTAPAETSSEPAGFPDESREEMAGEISDVLLAYHEDVVAGDYQSAWALLSPRKRQQYLRESGYAKWARAQSSLRPYLDPNGLRTKIVALEGEGVARVAVTGMTWSDPAASCSEWSGLTWARYEGGSWAYDPGYSTTAARRREWQPRSAELLGGDC